MKYKKSHWHDPKAIAKTLAITGVWCLLGNPLAGIVCLLMASDMYEEEKQIWTRES
jgi:hypothetical protein